MAAAQVAVEGAQHHAVVAKGGERAQRHLEDLLK
jgi:hypothetical protein